MHIYFLLFIKNVVVNNIWPSLKICSKHFEKNNINWFLLNKRQINKKLLKPKTNYKKIIKKKGGFSKKPNEILQLFWTPKRHNSKIKLPLFWVFILLN